MADAGNSQDYKLFKAVTSGLWRNNGKKWEAIIKPLPNPLLTDDIHQTKLKNYLYDYYNLYHSFNEYSANSVKNNKRHLMNNIIYKVNSYRLKYWYFELITYK